MDTNNLENSPYATPTADLDLKGSENLIAHFKRISAWAVFGLSIITLGIYPAYWLYDRSKVLNSIIENKISDILLNIFIGLVILSIAVGFWSGFSPEIAILATANSIISVLYMIAYIVVLFSFRNRLAELTNGNINGIITFFASALYLQYKINQAIDNQ